MRWSVAGRPLTLAARRGHAANQMLAGCLSAPARAQNPTLRCRARRVGASALQLSPRPKGQRAAPGHKACHRLSRWDGTQRWDLASAGTSQYPLIRWAQHTNSHRLVGRSLRLWAPATASKPTTLACRVAKTRRVHKASGDRGDSPGADVPFISALFSPDQFRAFVKRYGPVALGKIHVAVCRGTPVHLTYSWLFARHSGGDRCSCVRWILPLCADGAVDPASAYAGRDDAPIIPAFVVQHRFVPG